MRAPSWASAAMCAGATRPKKALQGADVLALVTEWPVFRRPDFARIAGSLKTPAIFDGRNLYDAAAVEAAGIAYYGIGRGRSVLR
jgi:UDPglucose 6-dehydrogenase